MAAFTATQILWQSAGCPLTPDAVPYTGICWWCGQRATGHGRPISAVADTFPDRRRCADVTAPCLCMACGWTWSDAVKLPPAILAARLQFRLQKGGLTRYGIRGEAGQHRHLLLTLATGNIGRWSPGESARDRKPWEDAQKDLARTPVSVGACTYLGPVSPDEIEVSDEATEKFRSFHHYGNGQEWHPFTDSERLQARDWALSPPSGWWTLIIGDGKKHAAIYARPSFGAPSLQQSLYFDGDMIDYDPAVLARQILASERMLCAGARSADIETGRYQPRPGPLWRRVLLEEEPHLSAIRGGPTLPLVLYFTRSAKSLDQAELWPQSTDFTEPHATRTATPDRIPDRAIPATPPPPPMPLPAVGRLPEPAPEQRNRPVQLRLFG